ncbi:hypothetical protein BN8_00762 [Fibrisoma limi BUZ 3]|uniref:Bacteriocin-protection protein, YdeI/OmpD-associated family n=1 Tax=Fibrisoma limi BUZ 3 TaxID=1185876 RepID=I2GD41_9BACT|nr:YdeI/OmpD-associated family protein [Fibrisoma limi]CCH51815.1 hypothetical protein BN8_00762 [Fibrisoma limi BUZ 3]
MAKSNQQLPEFSAQSRQEWRDWLQANHATSSGIWLVSFKKNSGKPRVSYDEAVEEALCFGWIDSVPNKLDDERFKQLFTPRKPKSGWSRVNKQRIDKLIAGGLMTEAGLTKIEQAKQDGSWTKLDEVEDLTVPADLEAAFAENSTARQYFEGFPKSVKRGILEWLNNARRSETRQTRIAQIVRMAAQNKRAQFDKE